MMILNFAQGSVGNKLALATIGALIAIIAYYYLYLDNARKKKELESEFDTILNSDKYKVKGKFETDD